MAVRFGRTPHLDVDERRRPAEEDEAVEWIVPQFGFGGFDPVGVFFLGRVGALDGLFVAEGGEFRGGGFELGVDGSRVETRAEETTEVSTPSTLARMLDKF